jgi:hypothetical protein
MAIFNSYVKLPEGIHSQRTFHSPRYSTSEIHAVPYGRLSVPYGMQGLSLRGSSKGFQFAGAPGARGG